MEFQAIVLAGGRGTRMEDLTTHTPKCLLPIGNKPMIWYPVRMLEKAGFTEINIITLSSIKSTVETELKSTYGIKANLNIVGIDNEADNEDEEFGTANSLYLLKDKIIHDCVIVSCDLITSLNLQSITNFFRVKNASFVTVLADSVEQSLELTVPGAKGKYSPERDIIGLDTDTNRLLYFGAEGDIDEIKLKTSVLKKYPKIVWTNKLHDAHLYVVKKWLIDYVIDNNKIFSLKSDFLPFLCKKQFSQHKKKTNEINSNMNNTTTNFTPNKKSNIKPKLFDYLKQEELSYFANKMASNKLNHDLISVYAFIQADGICYRSNTLAIYAETNRQIMSKIMMHYQHKDRTESINKSDKSQVGSDSVVGEGTKIGDKTVIKRSVIGKNCKISEKCKITNSILMDNVVVAEGVIIHGSILCSGTKINQKSEFKDCVIGFNQDIITTGKYSNETIQDIDSFIDEE